jgi:hypothetical protein
MVIDGNSAEASGLARVKFERERIRLPIHVVESANHPRLVGKDPIKCGLLVLTPGRFRLVMLSTGSPTTGDLSRILHEIEEAETPGDVLDRTDNNARDGIGARLIPCTISPPSPGWRVNFPQAAKDLIPEKEERSFVFVLVVAGFIEIWFPDTLRRASSAPISELLP